MILILSNKHDISVDYLMRLLSGMESKVLRINTEDFVDGKTCVTFPRFSYRIEKNGIDHDLAEEIRSVWFRRPGKPFEFTPEALRPNRSVVAFAEDQWHAYIESLKSIDNVFWINDPDRDHIAENKILQLKLATEIGLRVPKTCITNNKEEATHFMEECGGKIVAKALSSPLIEEKERDYFVFTNCVQPFQNVNEQEFSVAPSIFQELLENKIDYRVTIIGDDYYAVRVVRESDNGVPGDWRIIKEGLKFVPSPLPRDIAGKCVKMVKKFGLVFGAIDLVCASDEFYFLEINPNGEWAWLQKVSGLPIAETIADCLVQGDANK